MTGNSIQKRGTMPAIRVSGLAFFAAMFLLLAGRVDATVLSAEASLSATQVVTGESFQLVVRVAVDQKEKLPWPTVEGLEPFTVTKSSGTSTSSQTTIINGSVSRSENHFTEFVYTLSAREGGTYAIGPIRFTHKGFDRELGRATVTVTKTEAGISTRTSLSKSKIYTGEQVLYILRIIPKEGVQSISLPENLQKLIGEKFFFQQLDGQFTRKSAMVDGRETPVFDIRIALFPLLSGPMALEGIPVEYRQVRPGTSQGQSMFDAFFGGGGSLVTQTATAAPLRLRAEALPPGAPDGFTGSVGSYTLSASLSSPTVAAGEPVTLTVIIRGNGLPKSVTRPVLPDLPQFEVYDPEESSVTAAEGTELWTTRTFKYVLIPGREGTQTIEGVAFPYFDPRRGSYVRAVSHAFTLRVTPGKAGGAASPLATQREITEVGADIRYIKTGVFRLRNDLDLPHRHIWFYALLLLPLFAFAGAYFLRRRLDRLRSDSAFSRRTQASSALRRRLKAARQALDENQGRDFYRALSEAVVAFPSDKLNREFRGLTLPEAFSMLGQRGAAHETAAAYDTLMQRCDFVLFAGMSPTSEDMRRDLAGAEALLARLDKELA
jgi:hypothetical protein